MVCNKCKGDGVRNEVMGKEFYYCRTCKDEISLVNPYYDDFSTDGFLEMTQMTQAEVDELFNELQKGIP